MAITGKSDYGLSYLAGRCGHLDLHLYPHIKKIVVKDSSISEQNSTS